MSSSAFVTMRTCLRNLTAALNRAGVAAQFDDSGGTNLAVRIVDVGFRITCWANPHDANRPWYWLNREPISRADQPKAALNLIIERRSGALRARMGKSR